MSFQYSPKRTGQKRLKTKVWRLSPGPTFCVHLSPAFPPLKLGNLQRDLQTINLSFCADEIYRSLGDVIAAKLPSNASSLLFPPGTRSASLLSSTDCVGVTRTRVSVVSH